MDNDKQKNLTGITVRGSSIGITMPEKTGLMWNRVAEEPVYNAGKNDASGFYHMYANGDDAKEFVISEDDYRFQFNLVGVCAYNSGVKVLAFTIEDSHPHFFLYGTMENCLGFKRMYETATKHHIASTRGGAGWSCLYV